MTMKTYQMEWRVEVIIILSVEHITVWITIVDVSAVMIDDNIKI